MCSVLKQEGVGIDVCSEGELFMAQKAKIPPETILLHGNNKSRGELQAAVDYGIKRIVVDNLDELALLQSITAHSKKECGILLRLNPGIEDVGTHKYIATGTKESKFGFYADQDKIPDVVKEICSKGYIKFKGLHCHIGSNIQNASFFEHALEEIFDFMVFLKERGVEVEELNIGGGLGIAHEDQDPLPDIEVFVQTLCQKVIELSRDKGLPLPHLMLEPGRSIVGQAGCTLYKIGSIKEGSEKVLYAAVNGGMSDNLRPALYQAKYTAVLANKMNEANKKHPYKIVGKCCEAGDVLMENIPLPLCIAGDVLVVFSTGAYTHSLASNYNKHTFPGVVFVREGLYDWVSKEQPLEDLIRLDTLPTHLR